MQRTGIVALVAALLSLSALPFSAQASCREVVSVTTRTSGGFALTPLDAIAFPVQPAAMSFSVVRQIVVCPVRTIPPVPVVIGPPVFVVDPPVTTPSPAQPSPLAVPRSPAPVVVGTAPADTVRDLAARGARYDRMVVTVSGAIAGVAARADVRGAPLTAFTLEAQGALIGVIVWGHPALQVGEQVRVTGPFYVSTPFVGSSGLPWRNVIEAVVLER